MSNSAMHPAHRVSRAAGAIIAAILILSGCASTEAVSPPDASDEAESGPATEEAARLEQLYWARQDSARTRYTQADVDFMTGMIAHHAQALVMSDLAEPNGAGPAVRILTARIINAQRDEIQTMQAWLRDRGEPVPRIHIDGLQVHLQGVESHHEHMPGMLSDEQMLELSQARDSEFDRLFLKYMIQHHKGAVTMVGDLFEVDGAAQDLVAFKLASDINVDQLTEIARMRQMLDVMSTDDG